MNFTGRRLALIRLALDWAVSDLQSQIGSCPNVVEYADDIEELEGLIEELNRISRRIDNPLRRMADGSMRRVSQGDSNVE